MKGSPKRDPEQLLEQVEHNDLEAPRRLPVSHQKHLRNLLDFAEEAT